MNADFEAFAEELRGIKELRGAPADSFIALVGISRRRCRRGRGRKRIR
jgi:hypothetical protein